MVLAFLSICLISRPFKKVEEEEFEFESDNYVSTGDHTEYGLSEERIREADDEYQNTTNESGSDHEVYVSTLDQKGGINGL